MPNFSGGVVQGETLTLQPVCACIVLAQHAAVEDEINASVRDDRRLADVEGVPITEPEIKLPKLGGRTEGCACSLTRRHATCRFAAGGREQRKSGDEDEL